MPRQKRVIATLVCFVIQYICSIEAWTNESFNMAESAWLQYMSSALAEATVLDIFDKQGSLKVPKMEFFIKLIFEV